MSARVAALMSAQHGLVLRRQALEAGLSAEKIRAAVRRREWVVVRRGVYMTTAVWEALDPYRERPSIEVRAACLAMRSFAVVSHDSAAYLHGLEILEARPRLVHITRYGALGGRTRHGVKHHKAPHVPGQIEFDGELPVFDLARTAVDIAREHGIRHGLPAMDSAMRHGVRRSALWAAVDPMVSWPNVTLVRQCIEWADPLAANVAESLGRKLVLELSLGPVETQFGLREGGREVWCDLRVGRHIIEIDGQVKYRPVDDGGLADEPPWKVLWREKERQDWVCGFKLGMSRLTWDDMLPRNWEASKARVRREYLDTAARFGTSVDDLAPYVIRKFL